MQVTDLPLASLKHAPWNANHMDTKKLARLRQSIERYGLVENLVVRPVLEGTYEVIGGNWRFKVLAEMGFREAPCVVIDVDDAHARILAQALNRIDGQEDLGLRAQLVWEILQTVPEQDVLAILPETAESLKALASLGQADMASYIENWQESRSARLSHLQFQLTATQLDVVEEALKQMMTEAKKTPGGSPNVRGTALYLICRAFIEQKGGKE